MRGIGSPSRYNLDAAASRHFEDACLWVYGKAVCAAALAIAHSKTPPRFPTTAGFNIKLRQSTVTYCSDGYSPLPVTLRLMILPMRLRA